MFTHAKTGRTCPAWGICCCLLTPALLRVITVNLRWHLPAHSQQQYRTRDPTTALCTSLSTSGGTCPPTHNSSIAPTTPQQHSVRHCQPQVALARPLTTAVSHPRPHSSTLYVTTLLSVCLSMCSPSAHKTLRLTEAYDHCNPLHLHCPPPPPNYIALPLHLIFTSLIPLHTPAVHLECQTASTPRPFNVS
jgi:hypothetical protein